VRLKHGRQGKASDLVKHEAVNLSRKRFSGLVGESCRVCSPQFTPTPAFRRDLVLPLLPPFEPAIYSCPRGHDLDHRRTLQRLGCPAWAPALAAPVR